MPSWKTLRYLFVGYSDFGRVPKVYEQEHATLNDTCTARKCR